MQSSRSHMDALLYSHRYANGATEQLQMDLVLDPIVLLPTVVP